MSQSKTRLAAFIAPPLGASLLVIMMSCVDSPTTRPTDRTRSLSIVAMPANADAARLRQRMHDGNPIDWVGVSHNAGLDAVRLAMLKPGVLTTHMCSYVRAYASSTDRVPVAHRVRGLTSDPRAADAGLKQTNVCRTASSTSIRPTALHTSVAALAMQGSSALYERVADLESAIDASTTSYDFAARLDPIYVAAATLDAADHEVFLAVASVALNSFEYWESSYEGFASAFNAEYGTCLSTYSSSEASTRCYNEPLTDGASFVSPEKGRTMFRFASATADDGDKCDIVFQFKKLIKKDLYGALVGALSAFFIPTIPTIAIGAGRGALAASLAQFFESTDDLWHCIVDR